MNQHCSVVKWYDVMMSITHFEDGVKKAILSFRRIPCNHFKRDVVSQKNKSKLYFDPTRDDNENKNEDRRPVTDDRAFISGLWSPVPDLFS